MTSASPGAKEVCRRAIFRTILLITGAAALDAAEPYVPPADGAVPGWEATAPTALGLDSAGLVDLQTWLGGISTDAFLIVHRGRLVAEWHWNGRGMTTSGPIYSFTKTMVAAIHFGSHPTRGSAMTTSSSAQSSSALPQVLLIGDSIRLGTNLSSSRAWRTSPPSRALRPTGATQRTY